MRTQARWIRGLGVALVSTFLVVGGAFAADGLIRSGGSDDGTRVVNVTEPTATTEPDRDR